MFDLLSIPFYIGVKNYCDVPAALGVNDVVVYTFSAIKYVIDLRKRYEECSFCSVAWICDVLAGLANNNTSMIPLDLYEHHFVQMVDCLNTSVGTADVEPSENLRDTEKKDDKELLSHTNDYGLFLLFFHLATLIMY